MPYYNIDESKNLIELYFLGRVSIEKHPLLIIDSWQWNPSKQCWYKTLSKSSMYSAEETCRLTKDYEDAKYLEVKLNGKDNRGFPYVFKIQRTGESTYTVISSNNLFPCIDCNHFVSVHANSCPHCGCTNNRILKSYFDKFINKANLDAEYKEKLITSLKHHAVFSSIANEMQYRSLDDIEAMIERQEKKHQISTIPNEYLEFHNYTETILLSFSLEKLNTIKMDAYDYEQKCKKIRSKVLENSKKAFKRAYESVVDRINEKREKAIIEEQQKRENSLNYGEKICPSCQKVFTSSQNICPECKTYEGLDIELKKLDVNSGAFFREASVHGYYMRPVGVTDYDARRFQKHMQFLEERHIVDDSNQFEGIDNMTNPQVIHIVAKHFEKKMVAKFGEARFEMLYSNESEAIRYLTYMLLSKGHPDKIDLSGISEYKQYCLNTYKNS